MITALNKSFLDNLYINFYNFKFCIKIHHSMKRLAKISSLLLLSKHFLCTNPDQYDYPFVQTFQFKANNPIEDRLCYAKLKSINGFAFSVFDGHGGDLVADFASHNLNDYLEKRLQHNLKMDLPFEEIISLSLNQAYTEVQNAFFMIFKQNIHLKKYKTVGACGLTAIVLRDSIHVGNSGDCEGIIVGKYNYTKTNKRLNAGQKQEQQRLYKEFPHQKDIVKCIKNTNYCYVKGRLQPTRSLGDFYLKHPEYNFTNLATFTGPYIDHRPIVTHFKREKDDKYLILATDGMWDELEDKTVSEVSLKHHGRLVDALFKSCIDSICDRNNVSFQKLQKIHQRRDLHDDISIIAVDLHKLNEII